MSKSKRLARLHKLSLELNLGSEDELVEKCARSVVRRAHPDKGGNTADIQRLQNARETWHSLRGRVTGPQPEPLARVGEKKARPASKSRRKPCFSRTKASQVITTTFSLPTKTLSSESWVTLTLRL